MLYRVSVTIARNTSRASALLTIRSKRASADVLFAVTGTSVACSASLIWAGTTTAGFAAEACCISARIAADGSVLSDWLAQPATIIATINSGVFCRQRMNRADET